MSGEQYSELARRVLYFASREQQRSVATVAGQAFEFVLRVGLAGGYQDEVRGAVKGACVNVCVCAFADACLGVCVLGVGMGGGSAFPLRASSRIGGSRTYP